MVGVGVVIFPWSSPFFRIVRHTLRQELLVGDDKRLAGGLVVHLLVMGKTGEPYGIATCPVILASRQCLIILIAFLEGGRIRLTVNGVVPLPLVTVDDAEPLPADRLVA